jgi:iron-sulfur cluster repair protein YtfE (RIC family)
VLSGADEALRREAQEEPLRVLVERYPLLLPMLSEYDVDTCCGGGRTLAEVADVHGIDPEELLDLIVAQMQGSAVRR